MATIKQGILGAFSGTVATVVGSSWRGIACMRGIMTSHKNPNTLKQQAQRIRFGACVKFANLVKNNIILPIWEKKAVEMTGLNLFVRTNQKCFNAEGNIENYQDLQFSVGKLPLPENIVVANNPAGNGSVLITWTDNSGFLTAASSDQLMVLSLTGKKPILVSGLNALRSVASASVQLPYGVNETVHLYIFFKDASDENYSSSFYAQLIISGEAGN